ncbi:MAG: dockerin type I repeat-containing protein [Oscillospiraceae bacterium]|nr:dockerin type I repeat-containing protein [Oscillospiraceae bacterium]
MKIKSILTATISTVMLLISIGNFSALSFSDEDWAVIENCQGVLETRPKDYILPYSFEEFLALSDKEFLALEDVPQSAKEYYEQNREYIYSSYIGGVKFQLNDDVKFVETDHSSEAWEKELCEILGIPFEIVQGVVEYEDCDEPYRMTIKDDAYMGYPAGQVKNKAEIYIHFHEAVLSSDFIRLYWTPNFVLGDIDCDGEVGVTDVVMLQKWLRGSGNLPNWQSADLHQDGIINIFDLMLLKRMLIQK